MKLLKSTIISITLLLLCSVGVMAATPTYQNYWNSSNNTWTAVNGTEGSDNNNVTVLNNNGTVTIPPTSGSENNTTWYTTATTPSSLTITITDSGTDTENADGDSVPTVNIVIGTGQTVTVNNLALQSHANLNFYTGSNSATTGSKTAPTNPGTVQLTGTSSINGTYQTIDVSKIGTPDNQTPSLNASSVNLVIPANSSLTIGNGEAEDVTGVATNYGRLSVGSGFSIMNNGTLTLKANNGNSLKTVGFAGAGLAISDDATLENAGTFNYNVGIISFGGNGGGEPSDEDTGGTKTNKIGEGVINNTSTGSININIIKGLETGGTLSEGTINNEGTLTLNNQNPNGKATVLENTFTINNNPDGTNPQATINVLSNTDIQCSLENKGIINIQDTASGTTSTGPNVNMTGEVTLTNAAGANINIDPNSNLTLGAQTTLDNQGTITVK